MCLRTEHVTIYRNCEHEFDRGGEIKWCSAYFAGLLEKTTGVCTRAEANLLATHETEQLQWVRDEWDGGSLCETCNLKRLHDDDMKKRLGVFPYHKARVKEEDLD